MRKRIHISLIVLLVTSVFNVKSQNTMYFMERLPQNLNYNPALVPKVNFFIGLPGIGLEQAEFYNSGFNAGELLDFLDDIEMENFNPDEFINKLGNFNETFLETRSTIFSFGFKLKRKGYFSFSLSERNFLEMKAPSDIFYLLADYENYEEKMPIEIDDINVRLNTFSQLSVTWSKVFMEKLTIGISPKLTGALGGFRADISKIKVSKDGGEEYETSATGIASVGLPVPINPAAIMANGELNENEDIISEDWYKGYKTKNMFKNAGFAFDLGAHYKLNDRWSFSASLLDIGKTRWNNNDYLFSFADTVGKISKNQPFTLQLPVKLYMAANYQLSPRWNTGFVLRNVFTNNSTQTSATLSLNGYVGRLLSTSVSYTAAHTFDNIGFGFRLRFLPGTDLFVVTDNILHAFNYKNIQQASIALGVNFALGIREKRSEAEENIPVDQEIITVPGQ